MLFTSPEFLLLFLITFSIYYLPFIKQLQVYLLIVASLIFYAYSQPFLLLLLVFSIFINAYTSYAIVYQANVNRKMLATAGVVLNLAVIAFFKYSGMLANTLSAESGSVGAFLVSLPLPLGISFFTFEGISLLVDTYKDKTPNNNNSFVVTSFRQHIANTFLFVSFFPHLIAGPILKAHEFYPQIKIKVFARIDWDGAFRQLVTGYFLKMVIADNLKDQTFWISYPYFLKMSSETLLCMLFGYSMQIFADFAGYSLIALGLARLFGYELKQNFRYPYISATFADFWKRWHISLSSFLREYLYIPLGGNRRGKGRTYLNLFITMFLGGLWHGAAWSYAIWGSAHGLFLGLERLTNDKFTFNNTRLLRIARGTLVFTAVTFTWLLFKLPEFGQVIKYVAAIFNNYSIYADIRKITLIFCYSLPVVIYHFAGYLKEGEKGYLIEKGEWALYGLMLFLLLTNKGTSADFIYFQF